MEINEKTTINEFFDLDKIKRIKKYIYFDSPSKDLEAYFDHPFYSNKHIKTSFLYLYEHVTDPNFLNYLYTKEEAKDDPMMEDVNVMYFKSNSENRKKTYAIIVPGGGYNKCYAGSLYEFAKCYNERGYDAFVLTYRIGGIGLFPKPLDDLANAIKYIKKNETKFDLDGDSYLLFGVSAGSTSDLVYSSVNHGYKEYHTAKPKGLMLLCAPSYLPFIDKKENYVTEVIQKTMFGDKEVDLDSYNVLKTATSEFPTTTLICNIDDELVPISNSVLLKELLDKLKVRAKLIIGNVGGHNFLAYEYSNTPNWFNEALDFIEKE